MKHMSLKSVAVLFFSFAILATSCKKGDTGAQGEQGEQGETGATGATGATGSAAVYYSDWIEGDFGYASSTDTNHIGFSIDAPRIVDSILDKGEVHVYYNMWSKSEPYIVNLPFTDVTGFFTGIADYTISTLIYNGGINVYAPYKAEWDTFFPGTYTSSSAGEDINFYRYVIIPGGTAARSAVDWKDYKQVQKYLGLKD